MKVIIEESAIAAGVVKDSAQDARLMVQKILQAIERLGLFPEIGHEARAEGTYERGVSDTPYIVVYEVRKTPSAIITEPAQRSCACTPSGALSDTVARQVRRPITTLQACRTQAFVQEVCHGRDRNDP